MDAQERLRDAIDWELARLRAQVPADRDGAVLAILRLRDRLPEQRTEPAPVFDLISGHRLTDPGGNRALQLCLEAGGHAGMGDEADLEGWAEGFLAACGRLAEIDLLLGHVETGFMRLVEDAEGSFSAWIATKRVPTAWRERADIDWWVGWLARQHPLESQGVKLADRYLQRMAYQFGYPDDAVIGGIAARTYLDVLRLLMETALQTRDREGAIEPQSDRSLMSDLVAALKLDHSTVEQALAAFTLDDENAEYHAAVPGVAAAPVIRLDAERVVLSSYGLTMEPLLFLTRELRRRDPQEYHNSAHLRESVFRQDLYALFEGKRFVTSPVRIVLRRDDHNARTDIDAAVFDRKTGTLGLFELKSQDPFARSTAELNRQRDTVLYANRQISGILDWIKRHGANELLSRIDNRTAKTFRAQRVLPFVLGRYLAHFNDGQEPDRRAAWGTWPQLLRLLDTQPIAPNDANPILSLFNRLAKDQPNISVPEGADGREIAVGELSVTVYSSYGAFQSGG